MPLLPSEFPEVRSDSDLTSSVVDDLSYAAGMGDHERRPPPDPVIETYKRDVDRSLIRQNLRRSVEERLEALMQLQRFAEELHRAGRRRANR
jgi:hypothetical protein